ncbi:hypothetical protein AX16_002186 [Volvariella volvacea WC 439]|nr:hypothetical protein AX16_002186 [Volvariella volvacea WC 439]
MASFNFDEFYEALNRAPGVNEMDRPEVAETLAKALEERAGEGLDSTVPVGEVYDFKEFERVKVSAADGLAVQQDVSAEAQDWDLEVDDAHLATVPPFATSGH